MLLGEAEARIQEAKERMDISMASEDMVEQLTEKNMDLKEVGLENAYVVGRSWCLGYLKFLLSVFM